MPPTTRSIPGQRLTAIFAVLSVSLTLSFPLFPASAGRINPDDKRHQGVAPDTESSTSFDIRWLRSRRPDERARSKKAQTLAVSPASASDVVVRWNDQLDLPHCVLSLDSALSAASQGGPVSIAKRFIRANRALYGISDGELESARLSAYSEEKRFYTRLVLDQMIGGIRVYGSEMLFIIDEAGRLLAQSGSFIPRASDRAPRPSPTLTPSEALNHATRSINAGLLSGVRTVENSSGGRDRFSFVSDELDSRSEASLVYFPVTQQEIRLAYQILLYGAPAPAGSYLILIDAESGELLLREPLTFALQPSMARVFTAESPSVTTERSVVMLAEGWTNGSTTEGNNAAVLFNPRLKGGEPIKANAQGSFDFPLNLESGLSPLEFPEASGTNLFYWVNFAHDRFYSLGFDEGSRNFQADNFGRGGAGGDAVRAETLRGAALDQSNAAEPVRNNAYFLATLEGTPPLLAMLMWTYGDSAIQRDSSYDAGVIIHEYTHGVSTRLAGTDSTFGLRGTQGNGMGEGWSDFFALSFLDNGDQSLDAPHPIGSYVTREPFRGVRSYPYSLSYDLNPLTFGDIAFNTGSHAIGTVWCQMLWELRQSLIARFGFEEGRRTAEQLVVDGLKLIPMFPLFTDARDAILLADRLRTSGANQDLIWQVFAKRGLGASAVTSLSTSLVGFRLTAIEAFDVPAEMTGGQLVINEKPPAPALIGESMPVVVSDRDLVSSSMVEVTAINLDTGIGFASGLSSSSPGRFAGDIRIVAIGESGGLAAEAGDTIVIRYQNSSNQSGSTETIEVRTTAVERVTIFADQFDATPEDWVFSTNGDGSNNFWHLTKRRAMSAPGSFYFAKEKAAKSFTPRGSRGMVMSPPFDLRGILKPRLEFDYFFDGFTGSSLGLPDSLTIIALNLRDSPADAPLSITYALRPNPEAGFVHASVDLSFVQNHRAGFTLSFAASNIDMRRKDFEGFFIDNVRITGAQVR